MTYNLLNNKNDNEKVLPNGSGSYSIAHCDTNGSHAKPADVFIDGMTYNLLNFLWTIRCKNLRFFIN
jgi:hypothetical protein